MMGYEAQYDCDEESAVQHLDKGGYLSLVTGAILAVFAYSNSFLSNVFYYLKILVHELGHAFFAWLFGYPSIPAFDLHYGGGVAAIYDRKMWILICVYIVFIWLFYLFRKNKLLLFILPFFIGLYTLCAFTSSHRVIGLFMGHGTELVFAGICLYRAFSGTSIVTPLERPLYALIGFFIEIANFSFASGIMNDSVERILYTLGKDGMGGHTNDFDIIALDYLSCPLQSVIFFFFICCFIPPVVAFLFFRYKHCIYAFIN